MTAMHDPFGPLGAPGPRRSEDQRPAADPWETGEHIFRNQWNTAERRVLDAEWRAGQRGFRPQPSRPVGHPRPARAPAHVVPPVPAPAAPAGPRARARRGGRRVGGRLLPAAGWLFGRRDRPNAELAAGLASERDRAAALDDRTDRLEKQLAGVFDPEAVSSAVLPSVFQVRADDFTGTAFSVGDRAGAGADLLSNFHVVESVWESGDR